MNQRVANRINTIVVNVYKALGSVLLVLILVGLMSYLAVQYFFFVSHSWLAPTVVSSTDGQILQLNSQLAQQEADPEIRSVDQLKKIVDEESERKLRESKKDESTELKQQKAQDFKVRRCWCPPAPGSPHANSSFRRGKTNCSYLHLQRKNTRAESSRSPSIRSQDSNSSPSIRTKLANTRQIATKSKRGMTYRVRTAPSSSIMGRSFGRGRSPKTHSPFSTPAVSASSVTGEIPTSTFHRPPGLQTVILL